MKWTRLIVLSACTLVTSLWLVSCTLPRSKAPLGEIDATSSSSDWAEDDRWGVTTDKGCTATLKIIPLDEGSGMRWDYHTRADGGWIQLSRDMSADAAGLPIAFLLKGPQATGTLEIKFLDQDGSTFGARIPLRISFTNWTRITVHQADLEYWWGGDEQYDEPAGFHFAVSGVGSGPLYFDDVGWGRPELPSTFFAPTGGGPMYRWEDGRFMIAKGGPVLDPKRNEPGIGFEQRRAAQLIPEDPRVLEWLKQLQDHSSAAQDVLPTTEDNQLQTFNNSLVAIAFLLKGETERAERILDFFAARTVRDNDDPTLQNFFYKGEARGFFQHVELKAVGNTPAYHHGGESDRWMGDMAWLSIAYKYHEQVTGTQRYQHIQDLLKDLLMSWFTDSSEVPGGGYVRHGWCKGDRYLHESFGHAEGNIDCYALFTLHGEHELAQKIRIWLEATTDGDSLPLDVYAWRVQAYGGDRAELLDIPDHDLRYRKTMTVNGQRVAGPYHSADIGIDNIWLDGLGHLSCAYAAAGNIERGDFYANQFDPLLMDSHLGGKQTKTLPYTVNEQGGFSFDQSKGFISAAAWYIFAKNRFNPMTLTIAEDGP